MWVDSLGSNKPVLPTALNGLVDYASGAMRRQTGQPFDAWQWRETGGAKAQ